jgi:hypothetical protein
MADDSSNSSSGSDNSKKLEFDLSDIPGLNLADDWVNDSGHGVSNDLSHDQAPAEFAASTESDASAEPDLSAGTGEAPEPDVALPSFEFDPPSLESESPSEEPAPGLALEQIEEAPESLSASSSPNLSGDAIQKVKEFSEKMPMEKVQVPAAFPFSLLIEGPLTPEEKEKLLDVLSRENIGIREVDLEPQFESNRVLLPRISEYAGILLVQALRGTRARMRLGPSDSIFSAHDSELTRDPLEPGARLPEPEHSMVSETDTDHPAEQVAITPDSKLPQLSEFDVIDTILASALVESTLVEATQSPKYSEILEDLKRELKYRAYRKGAVGIIHFKTELQQLSLATQYRLTLSGAAIRPRLGDSSLEPMGDPTNPLDLSH